MSFGFGFGFPRGGNAIAWSPLSLFTGGVQGAIYDPSYLNTYMSGLGPEATSGAWLNGYTTTFDTFSSTGPDSFTATTTGAKVPRVRVDAAIPAAGWYKLQFTPTFSGGSFTTSGPARSGAPYSTPIGVTMPTTSGTPFTTYFYATEPFASFVLNWNATGASTLSVSGFSVKEVTTIGNATMFTTSAGTTPVTAVEQNVGLILDQSQGLVLGSEVVTNGGFATDTDWTKGAGVTISGGTMNFSAATSNSYQREATEDSSGKVYEYTIVVSSVSAGSIVAGIASSPPSSVDFPSITAAGTYTYRRRYTGTTAYFYLAATGFTGSIDSVSCKPVTGNHAYVTADANRGILRSRFNQLTYSEQFDNAVWTKSNSFIQTNLLTYSEDLSNAVWGPTGATKTASTFTAQNTNNIHAISNAVSFVTGSTYTFSIRLTYVNNRYVTLRIYDSSQFPHAVFDLVNGTFVEYYGAGTLTGATITQVSPGVFDLFVSKTSVATGTGNASVFLVSPTWTSGSDPGAAWLAAGTESVGATRAQLVQGSVPGNYRATTASALPILYTDPLGGLTAMELGLPSGGGLSQFFQPPSITSASLTDSIWIRSDTPVTLAFGFYDTGVGDVININVTTSWQRVTHTRVAGLTGVDRRACWLYKASVGGATVQIWGGQLVPTAVFPTNTYQRIAAATDYATGPAFPLYIQTDGTNDAMLTNTINFANGPSSPPLGPELVTNGDFSAGTTGWSVYTASLSVSGGEVTVTNSGVNYGEIYQSITTVAGQWYKISATLRVGTALTVNLRAETALTAGNLFFSTTTSTSNVVISGYFLATGTSTIVGCANANTNNGTGIFDNISVKLMDSAYAPDKMTVTAGVTKLSDASVGVLTELGNTDASNGTLAMFAPGYNTAATYRFVSRGTALSTAVPSSSIYPAPITNVLVSQASINGDIASIYVNDVLTSLSNVDQGTGTFGNYPLYLFARGNVNLYFTGYFYGAVVVQKFLSAGELASLTNWMEVRTFGKDMSYDYYYVTLDNGDLVTLDNGDPVYTNIYYS